MAPTGGKLEGCSRREEDPDKSPTNRDQWGLYNVQFVQQSTMAGSSLHSFASDRGMEFNALKKV